MSSSVVASRRIGSQRPTHLVTPDGDFDFTDGDVACDLAESLGLVLLDWQRWLVRWILATDSAGQPACSTVILIVPRQNGKGAVLEALELFWLILAELPEVIHTAHEADTAAKHMRRVSGLTAEPEIDLPKIHTFRSNGKERTENLGAANGRTPTLQYRTRTKAAGKGSSPQRVVFDECQELQDAHIAALIPAMAAQSMSAEKLPQLIYTGSAPVEHSFYMHDLIERTLEKRPPRTLLAMWACDPDDDPDDVDNWYKANPSLGLLISEDWVRVTEHNVITNKSDFASERLGVPKNVLARSQTSPIPLPVWDRLVDQHSTPDATKCRIAIDTDIDRNWFTTSLAGFRADGLIHCELTKSYPTKAAAITFAVGAAEKLGVDLICSEKSGLADDITAAGGSPDVMKPGEQAAATSRLIDATRGDAPLIRHVGESSMRRALEIAQTATYGDGGVSWSRKATTGDISPLTALTMAFGRLVGHSDSGPSTYEQRGMTVIG